MAEERASGFALTRDSEAVYILVHGGGPKRIVSMQRFKDQLAKKGISSKRIFMPTYDYKGSVESMSRQVQLQIDRVIQKFPSSRIEMVTHSLGSFIGVHALATSEYTQRVNRVVNMAGVVFGQDKRPGYCRFLKCPRYMYQLAPHQNNYVRQFWNDYSETILEWQHCAVYSTDDRRVNAPYDAGVIDPTNVEVVDGWSHLSFIRKPQLMNQVIERCLD